MAYWFGDGFDCYAAPADAIAGYWDSGTVAFGLVAGRFPGSQAVFTNSTTGTWLVKSSGQNDAVHHILCAIQQTNALSGGGMGMYFQLSDGATAQCSISFRQDGAIVFAQGNPIGTVLATYTGALTAMNVWYAFEFEVVIHPTAGSFAVRKNGNPTADFTATSLNTRPGTNTYANRLSFGQTNASIALNLDDLLWRSDASSVPWVGDIRCFTRRPVSDASVAWSRSGSVVPVANFIAASNGNVALSINARYIPFTVPCDGTVATLSLQCTAAVTANIKCSIYAGSTGAPTTPLGNANLVTNPSVGTATFTFASPVSVSRGATYFAAFVADATSGTFATTVNPPAIYPGFQSNTTTYAAFPVTNPTGLTTTPTNVWLTTINITPTGATNAPFVADLQQDGANSYNYSSTVSQSDLYGIAAIGSTPASIVGVTTRGYFQKSDAGTRNVAVQLQSGATNVQSASTALTATWGWISRTDLVDPATGSAWTATGVNNAQVGAVVTA